MDGIKCIEKLQSYFANMTFSDKSRYDRTFQQVTHKGGESAMNYIKTCQNAQDLSVSVGNFYSEDQLMHTFLDSFHKGGKYSSQIAIHQAELRREEKFTDQKQLNISSLHTDYLNLNSSSGFGRNRERENTVQTKCTFCGGTNHSAKNVSKGLDRKRKNLVRLVLQKTDKRNGHLEKIRCGSEDHLTAKCPKPPYLFV